ncbi:MAG TPA: FtsX-like permease family protein [Candidatus Limnocylindrales bacterium]|nr:FtsX-like permease family protein [Candidatus Limnocylindrales bacterium]
MRSLLATWRVSLARTRADWPIVAAAWLITLLAAILFSAGLIYPSAATEAGLRRALADAPPGATDVDTSFYASPADAQALDAGVQGELQGLIGPLGGSIVRDWRTSVTLAIDGLPGSADGDQAVMGYLDGLADHASLVEGAWPASRPAPSDRVQVVLLDILAESLGLDVGDRVDLVAHPSTQPVTVPVTLVGTFAVTSSADGFWGQDDQLLSGVHANAQYRTIGPFLTTVDDLLATAGGDSIRFQWRTYPDFQQLRVDDVGRLRARIDVLEERVGVAAARPAQVDSALSALLADAERSLLVSRTSVLLVMAQLAILAAYAIVLTATLLVDHRRIDTAMLRSRGAGAGHIAVLALFEGLLLAIPAVAVAPWLAVATLRLFNVTGPLADVGLRIDPRVSPEAYVAAAAAGIVCVALLVLPAALSARRFAAAQGDLSRQERRTFGQRMGLDIALLAVTGIALWQLRLYGAPLTRSVQGSVGMDPLLVAAPAIALIAGGVLALRVLPLLAQVVESAVSKGRSLVLSLGSRQLARRPLRYTRAALLLMLAMSMGVFALSYATTWAGSQRDQAAYQAGADARVKPVRATQALPAWALPAAYGGLPSVEAATPVERIAKAVTFPLGGSVDLLAIDTEAAAGIVLARGDEGAQPLATLFQPLREARPAPGLATLPEGTTYLQLLPHVDLRSVGVFSFNDETGEATTTPLDPATLTDVEVGVSVVIRDARGLLYTLTSGLVPWAGAATPIVLPLQPVGLGNSDLVTATGAHLEGPVQLAAIGLELWLPDSTLTSNAVIGVDAVAAGTDPAGPWSSVALDSAGIDPWSARMGSGRGGVSSVPDAEQGDALIELSGEGEGSVIFGGAQVPAAVLSFLPATIAGFNDPVPVIVNRALLEGFEAAPGDVLTSDLAGRGRRFVISGVVESFPSTDPAVPLVVLDEPTLGLLRLQGRNDVRTPDEWWLHAAGGDVEALAGDLRAAPLNSIDLVTVVDRTRTLSTDPVALGIIGALTLGFVATGLFAIVGLTVSTAVAARQRRTEFALLRALGLSGRQLATTLWLENGSLVLVSLVAGTTLGLVIGWLVLPFVTVTQRATAPVPPVIVHVPWDGILLLDLGSAAALGIAVVLIGGVLRRLGVGSVLRMGED